MTAKINFLSGALIACFVQACLPSLFAEQPAFRALQADKSLDANPALVRAARLIQEIKDKKLSFPDSGSFVYIPEVGGQAEGLGVTSGSVITSVAGISLVPNVGFPKRNKEEPIIWTTPDHVEHRGMVQPGFLGVRCEPCRNMASWYLHHGQRGAGWDTHVVAALLTQGEETDLAESLWARVMKQGYKADQLSKWCGMMLAIAGARAAEADAFANSYGKPRQATKADDFPLLLSDWAKLALATGNATHFMELVAAFPEAAQTPKISQADAEWQMKCYSQTPAETPPPSELALKMKRRSFLKDADITSPAWMKNVNEARNFHFIGKGADSSGGRSFHFSATLDHYSSMYFSPKKAAPNIDVEICFTAAERPFEGTQVTEYIRCFIMTLADRTTHLPSKTVIPTDAQIVGATLDFAAESGHSPGWAISYSCKRVEQSDEAWDGRNIFPSDLTTPVRPIFTVDKKNGHTLRLVRVNGRAEALLDGKRLALVSVPMELKESGVRLQCVGTSVEIKSIRADVLE